MQGMLVRGIAMAIAGLVLLAVPAGAAQDDDDVDWSPSANQCILSLFVDEQGTANFSLTIGGEKTSELTPKQVEQALSKALGNSLQNVRRHQSAGVMSISGSAEKVFPPVDGVVEGDMDLAPLGELLRAKGVEAIHVTIVTMPNRPSLSQLNRMRPRHYQISTSSPEPLHFVLDSQAADWGRSAWILAGLFLAPIAVVLWKRRAAVRAVDVEPAVAWYRFWRWIHWITLGNWLVWLTAVAVLRGHDSSLLSLPGIGGFAVDWIVTLAPPWFIMLFCGAVSQEVFARLTKADLAKTELLRRTASGLAVRLLPLLAVVMGVLSLTEQRYQAAAAWFIASFGLRTAGSWLASSQQALTPHAVTTGELRDRIFTLARQAGVVLKQLYILPTGKMREANALALRGQSVIITDHLLQSLSRREVDAIAAHELGHLKYRHHSRLTAILLAVLFIGPLVWAPLAPVWLQTLPKVYLPLGLVLPIVIYYFVSRRFELQTDSYAAWLTGDPEALITGLIRIHKLNLMPMRWGKWEEGLLTHPSTDRRLESIARQNGISRRRLEELVNESQSETGRQQGETYALPQELSEPDVIFSTALKRKYVRRITLTHLAAVVLIPTLVAAVVWWAGVTGGILWGILAGGLIVTGVIVVLLDNYLPVWAYNEVQRRLREKLKAEGIDLAASGGTFVCFAPDASLRIYEGYTNWDFGFLFLEADRLCYVGERTRFALRRDQVTSLHLGGGMPRWWPSPVIYIAWIDQERSGTLNFRSGQARSMHRLARETKALENRLQSWKSGDSTEPTAEASPALVGLCSPSLGEVTAVTLPALRRPALWLKDIALIFSLAGALGVLLGLPLRPEEGGIGWYPPVVAVVCFWVLRIPLLIDRRFWKEDEGGRQGTR